MGGNGASVRERAGPARLLGLARDDGPLRWCRGDPARVREEIAHQLLGHLPVLLAHGGDRLVKVVVRLVEDKVIERQNRPLVSGLLASDEPEAVEWRWNVFV